MSRTLRVARFLRSYLGLRAPGLQVDEVQFPSGAGLGTGEIQASLLRPINSAPVPGWIVLHGITVTGRHHPGLARFARSLASSGAAVLIPEIPAWRRLRLDSAAANATISASIAYLRSRTDVIDGSLNLVGFSFGGTQALTSAVKPGIREAIGGVVAFGAFCDLAATARFMMTGEHEWQGVSRTVEPDPYGRWILAGNYVRRVPEFSHMGQLETAVLAMATEAGTRGVYASESEYDELQAGLRADLPRDQQQLWDLVAPSRNARAPIEQRRELADLLVAAALRDEPELDPRQSLSLLDQRIVLAHGYSDRLIPYTETLRLRASLPPSADARVFITRLFAHSREAERLGYHTYPREMGRYLALLRQALEPC